MFLYEFDKLDINLYYAVIKTTNFLPNSPKVFLAF